MSNFTLTKDFEEVFPQALQVEGDTFFIRTNFKDILRIFNMFQDENILERYRFNLFCKMFYVDKLPSDAMQGFNQFLANEIIVDDDDFEKKKQFCFEFDADVIYTSFLKEYQVNLLKIKYLHWYDFKMMLANLSNDSPLSNRIALRFLDLKNFKGEELHKASKEKQKVQLPVVLSQKELEQMAEFLAFGEL